MSNWATRNLAPALGREPEKVVVNGRRTVVLPYWLRAVVRCRIQARWGVARVILDCWSGNGYSTHGTATREAADLSRPSWVAKGRPSRIARNR